MSRRGFTLIELALVLVIMGLMIGVAAPSFSRGLSSSRLGRASTVIASDLELAFTYAARQRRPVRVAYDNTTLTYTIADRRNGTVYVTRALGTGTEFTLSAVTFSATPVDVFPGGFASGSLTITITGGSSTKTVQMTRAGLVRVT